MFRRTPVTTRLERQDDRDQAQWQAMTAREHIAQDAAAHMHGIAFWSGTDKDLAAETRAWDALEAVREERRALAARWQERDARDLARLGKRGGTLHQLLREHEREEQLGEHAYSESGWRQTTPAETWLRMAWEDICHAHRDLTYGDTRGSATPLLQAIGARAGDQKARGWVEACLQDDRDFAAQVEREREEWFAAADRDEGGQDADGPAAARLASAPEAEAQ